MGMMTVDNLTNIYTFFRICKCPRLEKLFIEVSSSNLDVNRQDFYVSIQFLIHWCVLLQLPTTMNDPYVENYLMVPKEEPPEVDFEYLKIIKINNFNGHRNEMQLVRFLLGKAGVLEPLMVITSKDFMVEEYINTVDGCHDSLDFLQSQLSLFTKASVNAQIILSDRDDNKLIPTHWEVYSKV